MNTELQSRVQLTEADVLSVAGEVAGRLSAHLQTAGSGVFVHPHEATGCLFGQLLKLSAAADAAVYSGKTDQVEERLWKTALPALFAIASCRKLGGEC